MKDITNTQFFQVETGPQIQAKDILEIVYNALVEKGYNPVNQIVGYIMSGDPTYITSHKGARSMIMKVERDELVEELDCVTERKGKGLMQGIVVTKPLAEVNKRAIEEGILIIQAQGNVIRFVPPLIVEEKHIDEMIEKLKRALA